MLTPPSSFSAVVALSYAEHNHFVSTVDIRKARRTLSALLDEMRKGREVVITERGRPVAKLVPPDRRPGKGVPNLAAFCRKMPGLDPPLSATVSRGRTEQR